MKQSLFSLLLFVSFIGINAQSVNDAGRIVLNSVVLDRENKIPEEIKNQLLSKLTQISANSGMGGNSITPRFVIAAKINIITKDIVAGPPQMMALNAEIVFFIGDAEANQVFATSTITGKGLGTNENKALISLIQNINVNNKILLELTQNGKNKIIDYYNSQCDFILKKADAKADQQQYDEALYHLTQVPELCKNCYIKCLSEVQKLYKKKIDRESILKLNEAKNKWNAHQDRKSADEIESILSSIEPESNSFKEASEFSEMIKVKIKTIEKRDWDFKMKKYNDDINLETQRIESAKQAAIAYYQNQPKTIIYNRIIW